MPIVARRTPLLHAAMVGGAGHHAAKPGARVRESNGGKAATADRGQVDRRDPAEVAGGEMSEIDRLDALEKLGHLHDSGVLTDEQFEAERERLL